MLSTGLGSTTERAILPAYVTATQSNSRSATHSPIVERDCNGPLRTANPEASPRCLGSRSVPLTSQCQLTVRWFCEQATAVFVVSSRVYRCLPPPGGDKGFCCRTWERMSHPIMRILIYFKRLNVIKGGRGTEMWA